MQENSEDPDQTPHFAVSVLGLHCMPMSHKQGTGLILDRNINITEEVVIYSHLTI